MSASCLRSLLQTAGFEILEEYPEPFAHTVICRSTDVPFAHRLLDEAEAYELGAAVSAEGLARPA